MTLKSVAVEENSGLYASVYPGSFSVSLTILRRPLPRRSMYFMRWNRSAITGFRRMERIPRSHRMKFCVQRGLGALPSTSKRRGKSRRDFLLCGPVCINTGIACLFSPKLKRTSERIVKVHSLAQFVSNFSDNSVSSFTVSWV